MFLTSVNLLYVSMTSQNAFLLKSIASFFLTQPNATPSVIDDNEIWVTGENKHVQ